MSPKLSAEQLQRALCRATDQADDCCGRENSDPCGYCIHQRVVIDAIAEHAAQAARIEELGGENDVLRAFYDAERADVFAVTGKAAATARVRYREALDAIVEHDQARAAQRAKEKPDADR